MISGIFVVDIYIYCTKESDTMTAVKGSPIISMLKGLIISYILTAAVFLIYALLITYTDVTEDHISTAALITTAAVCIICGFITARSADSRGLIWGIISGVLYVVMLLITGFLLIPEFMATTRFIIMSVLAAAAGGLGGIIGINLKHSK